MPRVLSLVALVLLLGSSGCGRDDVYEGYGRVVEVLPADKQVVIEHETIRGLMPAMTMSFDVPDPAVLGLLAPGQQIEFELEANGESFRVISVRNAGSSGPRATRRPSTTMISEADLAPSFSLTDQGGKTVSLADLRGSTLLVDFVFTQCRGPCPIVTRRHAELWRSLAPETRAKVRFVSISLDPVNDTPEALTRYAQERGADLEHWSFLTGPEAEVAEVVRRFGVGTLRDADGTIQHSVAAFLVASDGHIAKRWLGLEHTLDQMREQITELAAKG